MGIGPLALWSIQSEPWALARLGLCCVVIPVMDAAGFPQCTDLRAFGNDSLSGRPVVTVR